MNLSIDINYFIKHIESNTDKELLINYYENLQNHISICKEYIKVKKNLSKILINYNTLNNESSQIDHLNQIDKNQHINNIIKEIDKMINLITIDADHYKTLFKTQLFLLIKK